MSFRRQSLQHGLSMAGNQPNSVNASPQHTELQRRESLVKPTWQNVCPGQVSPKTLERVNGIEEGLHELTVNNNHAKADIKKTRKQVELFDIFGKNKIVMVDHTRVKLQIWDTAGQERFRSVTHAYYRDAHALLLLYDVTNKVSFDNIRAWLVEIREYAQEDVVIMLLGNKADCGYERQVRKEEGERLAREYNVAFMETSAKTGLNVELAFSAVARQLKSRRNESIDDAKFNVQEFVKEQSQKPACPPCNM
ncbi:ras-related protein Rab-37-like isoform X2 [Hermetia illucens]|uniref:ras-related protein Rab-37-like isoform X2 n=1 Tax=Hermetia illucens TaxID=343691 RepID=UPI0018CC5F47|nr:ras-related protein Rab-37-like isoform X2 [Hermetia illucens]